MAIGILGMKMVNSALKKSKISYHDFYPSGKSTYTDSDIIMYLIKLWEEELAKEKINANKLYKILCCICSFFAKYCDENYDKFKVEVFLRLKDVKTRYTEFKEQNPLFSDKEIDKLVDVLDKDLNAGIKTDDKSEENDTKENEDIDDDIKKISEEDLVLSKKLQEKINSQNEELEKRKKLIESLKKELEKLKREQSNDNRKNEKILKEINEKEKIFETQEKEIKKLEKRLSELIKENEILLQKIKEHEANISQKEKELRTLIELEEKRKKEEEITQQKISDSTMIEKLIQNLIIKALTNKNMSHKELLDLIHSNGFSINAQELLYFMNNLSVKIKKNNIINGYPIYEIDNIIETDKQVSIIDEKYDFIFISGICINRIDNKDTLLLLDKIYNYCINNNIKYIVNLGNIFEVIPRSNILEDLKNTENTTYEIIKNYPYDEKIQNIMLGGFNETNISKLGYNPIERICNSRYDFYDLGYNSANINIGNIDNIKNMFRLYCTTPYNDYNSIIEFLNSKYSKTVLNIFASNTTSIIDLENRFITIPSLLNHGITIYHVQVNLNNNFLIMPLVDKEKLLVASQIHLN